MEPHDEFLELCAVSTSGELSEQEKRKLEAHLAGCAECRQALREFAAAVDVGVPFLVSRLSDVPSAASAKPLTGDPTKAERSAPRRRAIFAAPFERCDGCAWRDGKRFCVCSTRRPQTYERELELRVVAVCGLHSADRRSWNLLLPNG